MATGSSTTAPGGTRLMPSFYISLHYVALRGRETCSGTPSSKVESQDLNSHIFDPRTNFWPPSHIPGSWGWGQPDRAYERRKQLTRATCYYRSNPSFDLRDQLTQVCMAARNSGQESKISRRWMICGLCADYKPAAGYPISLSFGLSSKVVSLLIHLSCSLHSLLFIEQEWEEQGQREANLMSRFHSPYTS